ncbi:MAG: hypothetical protein JO236_18560 [Mycobacterium sp.]|uniref:hypothetical protein n=1 Tax=Mycobacterium sp. TaxID=1785 RepID=UPI001EC51284|nr:hypothetical protein [Mycobacterium sp.]MBW0019532.1 hypothetical protein [Mycobacterium sp.]
MGSTRSEQRPPAPANFEQSMGANFDLPGGIIIGFALIYATFRISRLHGLHVGWIWVDAVYLILWLALGWAFGVVAVRCGKAERWASAFAGLTAAAASVRALFWGFLLVDDARPSSYYALIQYLSLFTALALMSFGIAAHRQFRWWWSVPAVLAGFLDARTSALVIYRTDPYLGLIWLIPLVILGIAMYRTRVSATTAN